MNLTRIPPISQTTYDVVSTIFCQAGEILNVILLVVLLFIVSAIFIISALFSTKWILKLFASVNGSNAIDLSTKEFPLTSHISITSTFNLTNYYTTNIQRICLVKLIKGFLNYNNSDTKIPAILKLTITLFYHFSRLDNSLIVLLKYLFEFVIKDNFNLLYLQIDATLFQYL